VKATFVVLTFAGHASLWAAIAADMGASLLVIANGLRLLAEPAVTGPREGAANGVHESCSASVGSNLSDGEPGAEEQRHVPDKNSQI
jgi:hypothetical protein